VVEGDIRDEPGQAAGSGVPPPQGRAPDGEDPFHLVDHHLVVGVEVDGMRAQLYHLLQGEDQGGVFGLVGVERASPTT